MTLQPTLHLFSEGDFDVRYHLYLLCLVLFSCGVRNDWEVFLNQKCNSTQTKTRDGTNHYVMQQKERGFNGVYE